MSVKANWLAQIDLFQKERKKSRNLEKELAEASALLVLKKQAQAILGRTHDFHLCSSLCLQFDGI